MNIKITQKVTTGFQISYQKLIELLRGAGVDTTDIEGAKIIDVMYTDSCNGEPSISVKVEKFV